MDIKFEEEILELLPKEAIIELFKQRIVLTEEEFAEALKKAATNEYERTLSRQRDYYRKNSDWLQENQREARRNWGEDRKAHYREYKRNYARMLRLDPERGNRRREWEREWKKHKRKVDPDWAARENARTKEWYDKNKERINSRRRRNFANLTHDELEAKREKDREYYARLRPEQKLDRAQKNKEYRSRPDVVEKERLRSKSRYANMTAEQRQRRRDYYREYKARKKEAMKNEQKVHPDAHQ